MIKKIKFKKIYHADARINVWEKNSIKFNIKRIYTVQTDKQKNFRQGHAHKKLSQIISCLNGKVKLKFFNGYKTKSVTLTKNSQSIFVKNGLWREVEYQKKNSILQVFCNMIYDPKDYIRDIAKYKKWIK